MQANGKLLTVPEVAELTGLNRNTIYKHIRQRKLTSTNVNERGKVIMKLSEADIISFYGLNGSKRKQTVVDEEAIVNNHKQSTANVNNQQLTLDDINKQVKKAVLETIEEQKGQLMKPLQDQALYRLGRMEKEVEDLRAEKEILLQELDLYKALPGPVEEITAQLKEQAETINLLSEEKEQAVQQAQKTTEALHILKQEKEEAIEALKQETALTIHTVEQEKTQMIQEKEAILKEKEQTLQQIQKEKEELEAAKEREVAELKEKQAEKEREFQELQELKEKAEKEEQDYLATIEEMKKRLEEEERKPWWRKIFS